MGLNCAASDTTRAASIARFFAEFGVKEYTYPDDFVSQFDDAAEEIFTEIVDRGRWEAHMFNVYKLSDGSLIGVEHSEGLTENQDSTGVTDAYKVEPREIVTIEYYKV